MIRVKLSDKALCGLASEWVANVRIDNNEHSYYDLAKSMMRMLTLFGPSGDLTIIAFFAWVSIEFGEVHHQLNDEDRTEYFIDFENDCDATSFVLKWG